MPPVAMLSSARPGPYAGQNTQAFMKILQTLGHFEGLRRKRMMQSDILGVISQGGGIEDIAGVVQAHQQPQFDIGLQGLFQRIASPFAQAPGAGITDALTAQAITPEKPLTMSDIRMQEYMKAVATGDEERADKLLMSSLVTIQTGEKLLTPEKRQEKAEKDFEKAIAETPLTTSQVTGYSEAMDTRLDKAKRVWYKQPGRDNYPESELFKQWKIFAGMHKFKNNTQKEQIWNIWQNKVKNRAAKGWFGKETDFDPTDPKWRKAIGLSATNGLETPPPPEQLAAQPMGEVPTMQQPPVSDRGIQQVYRDITELRSIMSKLEKEGNTRLYNAIRKKWLAYLEAVNTGRESEESSPSQILEFDEVKAYRK